MLTFWSSECQCVTAVVEKAAGPAELGVAVGSECGGDIFLVGAGVLDYPVLELERARASKVELEPLESTGAWTGHDFGEFECGEV